jgi:uncharacterized protein (TIGR03437 family)
LNDGFRARFAQCGLKENLMAFSRALFLAAGLASTLVAQPSINTGGIVNVSGYQATLAPDTVFVIFGSGMGPATIATASAPSYPAILSGTSISFAPTSGAPVAAKIVYTLAGQVAGLLPSSIAPGTYAVTVTYNGVPSSPKNVTVAARSFGIATANSAGNETAQATIGNVNGGLSLTRFTSGSVAFGGYTWTLGPAHPGDTLVLWGTGGGADPANDTGGTSGDQTSAGNFIVNVGGAAITPVYAGAASGYPGLWQINFTLPATVSTDCFVPVQVSAGGNLGNSVTIPIAPTGQTSCTTAGFSPTTLATLQAGGNVTFAGMTIGRSTSYTAGAVSSVTELVGGPFSQFTTAEWLINFAAPKIGPCEILDETYPTGSKEPSYPDSLLDAGTQLTVSGLGLNGNTAVPKSFGIYTVTLPAGTLVNGGTYTLTGAGGTQVGAFSATATMPISFSVTNLSSLAAINRAQPVAVNWTGSGFDLVIIHVQTYALTTANTHLTVASCVVPAAAGTYTIPASVLGRLLPASGSSSSYGGINVTTGNSGGTVTAEWTASLLLTPPLVSGGQMNFGAFASFISVSQSATVQ